MALRLALKSISKSRIQKEADRHPMFRSLIPQSNHDRITTTMQRGYATGVDIGPSSEVQDGLLSVGLGALLIYEVQRRGRLRGRREEAEATRELMRSEIKRMTETGENVKHLELLKQVLEESERAELLKQKGDVQGGFSFGGNNNPHGEEAKPKPGGP